MLKDSDYIVINRLNKTFSDKKHNDKTVFKNFNIKFKSGVVHCILGKSGCGKSTLMRILADLETFSSGSVNIFGKNRDDHIISMILQENNLLPWLNIYDNLKFAITNLNINDKEKDKIIIDILEKYSLLDYKMFYPYELSVGMKQRVSLAKTFINNPNIILLDEPFCALDYITKDSMHNMFLEAYHNKKFTAIISTHFIDEAIKLADYIHILGENNRYKLIKNPLIKPRDKDDKYQDFLEFIKKEYI